MFGTLAICGKLKCYFVFHCHDFVLGVEILRLSILKMAELLAEHGLKLPRYLTTQFDNCGENKNKYMFGYLSLLVELAYFDTIRVSFLIVGHTHCIIDQWFSSVTKILYGAKFLGTAYAIEELLVTPREKSTFQKPMAQSHVFAIWDIKSMLERYINKDIKWFQVRIT